jgi:recombination protein RecA
MAKTKKEKAESAREERSKAREKNASKAQADLIKEYRAKMQASINQITKKLDCKAMGFEPPQGTNGAVSTGVLCVDLITGGGFPKHRMSTVAGDSGAGKSTLVGKSEGTALQTGLICHHLDLEGAADYTWMLKNGTDMNLYLGKRGQPKTLYYIPDLPSGDASFRYMSRVLDEAIANGAEDLPFLSNIFYQDSIPACIPESMLENDEKGNSPDLAVLTSREIPRVRMKLKKANAAYVAINQIRENPRAMFGCLHGDTRIRFVDGRVLKIRDIVNQKIEGDIWSFDEKSQTLVPKKILNWFNNGYSSREHWVSIRTESLGSQRGHYDITVTRNHKMLTPSGEWVEAASLKVGDNLVSQYEDRINGTLRSFLLGMAVGDSSLHEKYNRGALTLCNREQPEYLEWKVDKLTKAGIEFKQYGDHVFISKPRADFEILRRETTRRNPLKVLDQMTPLSMALWFMDDGCYHGNTPFYKNEKPYFKHDGFLSFKRLREDPTTLAGIEKFFNQMGYSGSLSSEGGYLFSAEGFRKLSQDISPFVPPCMSYKLLPEHRNNYQDFDLSFDVKQKVVPVKILWVREISDKKSKSLGKFDLEIEGTHNYVACSQYGGVVVHNSPIYEPGGNAPTFYADLKLWLTRTGKAKALDFKGEHKITPKDSKLFKAMGVSIEQNPDGTEDRYFYTHVKTVKNRVFPPLKETYFRMWIEENGGVGRGIDPVWDVIRFFEEIGMLTFESMKEVVLKGQIYDYYDLKKEILSKPDLYEEARSLLDSGKAFDLYFNRLRGGGLEVGNPDQEDDEE